MSPRTPGKRSRPRAASRTRGVPQTPERRRNPGLREVLDEMIAFVRQVSGNATSMSPEELEYAQQRMEWLADEVWRLVLAGDEI